MKKLVEETQDKNCILKSNNNLLLERIKYLEKMKDIVAKTVVQKTLVNNVPISNSNTNPKKPEVSNPRTKDQMKATGAVKKSSGRTEHRTHMSHGPDNNTKYLEQDENYGNETADRVNSLSNMSSKFDNDRQIKFVNNHENEKSEMMQTENTNTRSQIGTQRRFRRSERLFGNADIPEQEKETGFAGGDRKVWLYIYRVKQHVSAQQIIDFIKNKPSFENDTITAKELPGDPQKLKHFVVTAPLIKKDKMYDTNFWPKNVGIKRFRFDKHILNEGGDFLDQ